MQRPFRSRVRAAQLSTLIAASAFSWTGLVSAQSSPSGSAPAPAASSAPSAAIDTSQNRLDPQSPGMHIVDDIEPLPPLVPRAKDVLAGHVLVGVAAGPTWSLGRLSSKTTALDAVGIGMGAEADIGIGISRTFVLGLWGSFARYSDGNECNSCTSQAFAVGPFVRYQLSQGLRFVPWIAGGVAFRHLRLTDYAMGDQNPSANTDPAIDNPKLTGISWLRLELGGDYYAFSGFGFGPYGGLALSSYWDRPDGSGSARVSTELTIGLRLLLDVPGR